MKKKKKPVFKRTEHIRKNLKNVWRRPRGIDNKLKKRIKGRGPTPSVGYGNSNKIRGLVKGKVPVHVYNVSDLKGMTENQIAIIGSMVGNKKRAEILADAEKNKIEVKNK